MRSQLSLHQLYVCNRIGHALEDHVIFPFLYYSWAKQRFLKLGVLRGGLDDVNGVGGYDGVGNCRFNSFGTRINRT